jgi:hypothetical protein
MSDSKLALNFFMAKTTDDKGDPALYGKVGYQLQTPKTDKVTAANLRQIEVALDNGQLKDIHGNPCDDNAVIMVMCRVSRIKDPATIVGNPTLIGADGQTVEIAAPASSDELPV